MEYLCRIIFHDDYNTLMKYMLFTMLLVTKDMPGYVPGHWIVITCGDGYIIKQRLDDKFEYDRLPQKEYPNYYAYNFCPQLGLRIESKINAYSTKEYKNIGVATDGLRFILGTDLQERFEQCLINNSAAGIGRMFYSDYREAIKRDGMGNLIDDLAIAF